MNGWSAKNRRKAGKRSIINRQKEDARGSHVNRAPRVKIFRRKEGGLIGSLPLHRCCFRSHPRVGGNLILGKLPGKVHISTHAPTRGATPRARSISTVISYFNSRPRVGGNLILGKLPSKVHISTHAPARGTAGAALYTPRSLSISRRKNSKVR